MITQAAHRKQYTVLLDRSRAGIFLLTFRGKLGMLVFGIQMGCQTVFMGLGQAKISLFLALLRKVILLVPLAVILPKFFGVIGIYYAEPIADIISAATAGTLFLLNINKILKKRPDQV